jgi:Zn-finger nucleic acid-binding protein
MKSVTIGPTAMQECPKCEGLWVDAATIERIYAERERQVSLLQVVDPTVVPAVAVEDKVQYLPCPVCRKLMNRVNFAHYSNVIVDICKGHGTWFDRDELRRVIEFIRAGGLDQARTRELADLNERHRQLSAEERPTPIMTNSSDEDFDLNRHQGVSTLVNALMDWLR